MPWVLTSSKNFIIKPKINLISPFCEPIILKDACSFLLSSLASLRASFTKLHVFNLSLECVAEHKDHHLIVAYVMMFHMYVPIIFLSDIVLAACYLINRLPLTPLDGSLPFLIFFPVHPPFLYSPHIFDSNFLIHTLNPNHNKLKHQSV